MIFGGAIKVARDDVMYFPILNEELNLEPQNPQNHRVATEKNFSHFELFQHEEIPIGAGRSNISCEESAPAI